MGFFDFLKSKPAKPAEPPIPPEALTFWVHRLSHFRGLKHFFAQEHGFEFKFAAVADVFGMAPALLTDQGPIPLQEDKLRRLGMTFQEAFMRAGENAQSSLGRVAVIENKVCCWQGPGAEAFVRLGKVIVDNPPTDRLPIKGATVVMVPSEGCALAASANDELALALLLDTAESMYAGSKEYRSLRATTFVGEEVVEWLPPIGHPLRARFKAAAAKTRLLEAANAHQMFADNEYPLAHLAHLPAEQGGDFIAAWMRDTDVFMPKVDKVVLFDINEQGTVRLEVDWSTLLTVLPHAFERVELERPDASKEESGGGSVEIDSEEPLPESVTWVRTRGALFPTAAECAYLTEHMAFRAQQPHAPQREVPGDELLALWDTGAPVLANASYEKAGYVRLSAADGRFAEVTTAAFGDRMLHRSARDQSMFQSGFLAATMMQVLQKASAEDAEELDDDVPDNFPPFVDKDILEKRLEAEQVPLLSSRIARTLGEEEGAGEDESADSENVTIGAFFMKQLRQQSEPRRLFPVVRPPGYAEGTQANLLGMAKASVPGIDPMKTTFLQPVRRTSVEGLVLDLVSDMGNAMNPLTQNLFDDGLAEIAWRTALLNLEAASIQPFERAEAGHYRGPWHDDYDFSRLLLLPKLVYSCDLEGEPLVFAPTVGRVWVVGSENLAGLAVVLDEIDEHLGSEDSVTPYQYRQMLFGWPWVVKNGTLQRWSVPQAHPLASRIAALDARLEKRRASSRQHVGAFAQASYAPIDRGETST